MKSLVYAIREINFSLDKIFMFNVALNSVIVFLASYILLSLFSISRFLAFVPAAAYLIVAASERVKENKIVDVEKKYSGLREKLRTAADNVYVDNSVNRALKAEVLNDLEGVEESAFFNDKATFVKSAVIIALCIIIALSVSFHFKGINLSVVTDRIINIDFEKKGSGEPPVYAIGGPKGGGSVPDKEIFGMKSVATLGTDELKVNINPVGYELNVNNVQAPEEKQFNEQFPSEVFAQSAGVYEENIPRDQQLIVKNYFKSLASG